MNLDLHCHSTASDGLYTPQTLFDTARSQRLEVLSLTDHDTLANLEALTALAQGFFQVIPGIELSCRHAGENIHLLGYFDPQKPLPKALLSALADFRDKRRTRGLEMVRRLAQYYDIHIDPAPFLTREEASFSRAHLAELIQKDHPYSLQQIFERYLSPPSKAYLPASFLSVPQGVALLRSCGGLVFLAHPGLYKTPLEALCRFSLDGVEVYYPAHTPEQTARFRALCLERHLMMSCGSDDHGRPHDEKHGRLGTVPFSPKDLQPLLHRLGL
ncbi:putative metal-dependent phosphoesterases (PHP family) [Clostridiaceae bacterium JG1575]|nr:putative metal-dependent phosphoesterases (PHP family) [Clostridiaceae bacterium JG1575]